MADRVVSMRRLRVVSGAALLWAVAHLAVAQDLRQVIDREVAATAASQQVKVASLANDATFLRRVTLDLTGLIPNADETRAFLADENPHKREELVERLLASPRYGVHQADVWDMVLFGRNPPGYDAGNRAGFQKWLTSAFAEKKPYDEIVRALLRAEGNTAEQGAPMYLLQYDRRPEDAAVAVSQTLLGVQLQCARCHDHPYEPWTQRDFYGMAAFFARLARVSGGKIENEEKLFVGERNTGEVKFVGPAKEAKPGQEGEPIKPRFLGGQEIIEPDLSQEFKDEPHFKDGEPPAAPRFSRKDQFAGWVTSPDNTLFARAAVNRIWAQFMGRGLVHPVDNMSVSNPASHPQLLETLAREFQTHHYDLRWLIREIVGSETYQRESNGDGSEPFPQWFERARTRPLSAEELLESWRIATGYDDWRQSTGKPLEHRLDGVTFDYLRLYFGEPNNGVGDFQGGLQEHLYLNNGELDRLIIHDPPGLFAALAKSEESWEQRVDQLFLATLNRYPTDEERQIYVEHLSPMEQQHERIREAIWTLLTCSEFRFNH